MELEQELRSAYAERLDTLDPTGADVGAARAAGARLRVRRRLLVGAAAVAVVAVAVGGSLVGTGRVAIGPSDGSGRWRELPAPPLSPRAYALSAWTGREVVVLGGDPDPCSPSADCSAASTELRDGAAYDPATNTWRPIPPSPVPVGPGDRLVEAAGVVVLRHWRPHGSSWFTYEPDHNRWSRIDHVPRGVGDLPSAIGPRVYVTVGRRIAVYDVTRFRWSLLPPDPHRPALAQRRVTATPVGPVVTGYDATKPQDGTVTDPVVADVFDGHRWRRSTSSVVLGNDWARTGDRMIDFDSFAHQGMTPRPGLALGGRLDPGTGRWSRLPAATLETPEGGWSPVAVGPGSWAACWGLVYDVASGRVATLPGPDGAPDAGVTASWAGDRLLAFGGSSSGSDGSAVTNHAWLWSP